jgi:hypothetical protein
VARDQGQVGVWQLPVYDVEVGPAHGATAHVQKNLTRAWLGHGDLRGPQWLARSFQDHRSHGYILLTPWRIFSFSWIWHHEGWIPGRRRGVEWSLGWLFGSITWSSWAVDAEPAERLGVTVSRHRILAARDPRLPLVLLQRVMGAVPLAQSLHFIDEDLPPRQLLPLVRTALPVVLGKKP